LGYKAYAAAEDLPAVPDLVVFIVPNKAITALLEDFGKIGTKRAIIVTAGYKETGATGLDMEKKINEIAGRLWDTFCRP